MPLQNLQRNKLVKSVQFCDSFGSVIRTTKHGYLTRNYKMSDSAAQLQKVNYLCTTLQNICKKHSNFRMIAVQSLEETIRKFDAMNQAGKRVNKGGKGVSDHNKFLKDKVLFHTQTCADELLVDRACRV